MLAYCWASVADDGPTINQHWVNVLYLLHYCNAWQEMMSLLFVCAGKDI